MKASELRIRNYVMYSSIIEVNGYKIIEYENHPERFKPIPLTEEWLLKFGLFKLTEENDRWYNDDKGVFSFNGKIQCGHYFITTNNFLNFNFYLATIDDGMPSWEYIKEIKHVHTLQNLHFALTGEELI